MGVNLWMERGVCAYCGKMKKAELAVLTPYWNYAQRMKASI